MKQSFRDTSIPISSRAMNLVRRHHDAPPAGEALVVRKKSGRKESKNRLWKREARANHLRARRRLVKLAEIPIAQLPAILEVAKGSNFVILKEQVSENEFLIQFPDARESLVERERLEEVYDGACVLLNPRSGGRSGTKGSGGGCPFTRFFGSFRRGSGSTAAFLFNLAVLGGALLLAWLQGGVLESYGRRSIFLPLLASAAAGCASLGVIQLRRDFLRGGGEATVADLLFLPAFLAALVALGGWVAAPFVGMITVVLAYLVSSSRMGSVSSRLRTARDRIVGGAFIAGIIVASIANLRGLLDAGLMAGTLVLGTYSVYLLVQCDRVWQRLRLQSYS